MLLKLGLRGKSIPSLQVTGTKRAEKATLNDANDINKLQNNNSQESNMLLKGALVKANPEYYTEALHLERYRNALLDHAQALQDDIDQETEVRARELAPRVFGWQEDTGVSTSWQKLKQKVQLQESGNADEVYSILRRLEMQSYQLEDRAVADSFFQEVQLLMSELEGIDPAILKETYPWLVAPQKKELHKIDLFKHEV